jgi:putative DNA primase/helicase
MLSLASTEIEIATSIEHLDRDGWILNAQSGTIDLRTGRVYANRPGDLCTKRAEVKYDPRGTVSCPTWLQFLDTTFAGDAEMIAYVQRAIGYALTADTTEQCVFVLYGRGANGKSTFLKTLATILGDYSAITPTSTLMAKRFEGIPSDVARLAGVRFVCASEVGDGKRLDEELVKRMTGGERITARFMHHDWFEFEPVLKLFLAVNHKPTIFGDDEGIWRRIHLWPFTVSIAEDDQDKRLSEKLLAERPGILAWAVQGCLEWQRSGLQPPEAVRQATRDYRAEYDSLGRFWEDRCQAQPKSITASAALIKVYEAWCQENGERQQSARRLGAYLREQQGCQPARDARGARAWLGVELTDGVLGVSGLPSPGLSEQTLL